MDGPTVKQAITAKFKTAIKSLEGQHVVFDGGHISDAIEVQDDIENLAVRIRIKTKSHGTHWFTVRIKEDF
jgi:hypothetical protein